MTKQSFFIIFTFATLLNFALLGGLATRINHYFRDKKDVYSIEMLSQSQKTNNNQLKVLYAEYSNILNINDLAKVGAAKGYIAIGNKKLVNEKLSSLNNNQAIADIIPSEEQSALDRYFWLKDNGYPQLAHNYITFLKPEDLKRDELLVLANELILSSNYGKAHSVLKLAADLDPFYPQSYEQLLLTCEKVELGQCEVYKKALQSLTW